MKNRNIVNKNNFILSEEESELALKVDNLTFRYFNSEINIFKNLSFPIKLILIRFLQVQTVLVKVLY